MITLLIVVFIAVGVLGSVVMMFAKGMSWKTRLGGASWAFMGTLALAGLMHGGESSTTIAKTSESPAQGAQLIAQRSDTSICPEQTRTRLKRQAYIEVAGGENCEGIVHDAHGYGDIYWMREAAGSDLSACEELLQPALDKASAELKSRGHDGFCRRALAVRDGAPGTPGTKTVDELIATLRGNLADGERVSGTSNPTKSTAVLLDVLASQLAPHMPGIDVASWYSRGTPALNAGIMFGMHEPSNNRRALVWVWEGLSAHSVGTGISLLQWAYTLGVFRQADSLIEPAMVEMQISDF